jgi:hypothetical protein
LLVKGMQCTLVSCGDGSDQLKPLILGYANLCLIGIEDIPERLSIRRIHGQTMPSPIVPVKVKPIQTHASQAYNFTVAPICSNAKNRPPDLLGNK